MQSTSAYQDDGVLKHIGIKSGSTYRGTDLGGQTEEFSLPSYFWRLVGKDLLVYWTTCGEKKIGT